MIGSSVLQVPAAIAGLIQQGLIERAFRDGLFPSLQYRQDAVYEEVQANTGTEFFRSRSGLMAPVEDPTPAGQDPAPYNTTYEQWPARIDRYGGYVQTHMPTSAVANANLFLRNIHTLGLQAGQSLNRLPRNALFKAYLSGQTLTTAACVAADVTIHVASVNGFTDWVRVGTTVAPVPVSSANPLPVTIGTGASAITRYVVGVAYDDPTDAYGPGTLTLSAAIGGAGFAARTPVVTAYAPFVLRAGGGNSVDSIGVADTAVLTDLSTCINYLRSHNVQPHDDGYYHGHISSMGNNQLFADPVLIRLNTALPQGVEFSEGFVGEKFGCLFYMNNESPNALNSGAKTLTGTNAQYARSIGAEVTNDSGINVGRVIITGKNSIEEVGLDESAYISEAGITGKIGEFSVVNQGIQVPVERVRLILRSPINVWQDIVTAAWSSTVGFPIPTDATASSGPNRYKRAVVYEYAGT